MLGAVVEDAIGTWEHDVLVPDVGDTVGLDAVRTAIAAHRRFLTEDRETSTRRPSRQR